MDNDSSKENGKHKIPTHKIPTLKPRQLKKHKKNTNTNAKA